MNNTTIKQSVIATRCPECGAIIAERIDFSSMSFGEHIIKCKICGKNSLSVQMRADGKVCLDVPCLLCAHSHPYTVGSGALLAKDLFVLQCSYSGLDICFIGDEEKVDDALRASAVQLKEIFDSNAKAETNQNFLDADIMQEVMYSIEELAITNRIRCSCGEPNLSITIDYDKVHISCKDCRCKATLFASEKSDIESASALKKMVLE